MKFCLFLSLVFFSTLPAFALESEDWRLCAKLENGTETDMTHYRMTFRLAADWISGRGGCNFYRGEMTQNSEFLFENIMIQQAACLDENGNYDSELMEAERHFVHHLSRAQELAVNKTGLHIRTADQVELRFAPEGSCQ